MLLYLRDPPLGNSARVPALGGRWRGPGHAASSRPGRPNALGGNGRCGGGGVVVSGAHGPSPRLPIKHSAFAVFLGAEFCLEVLPAEATFRLSAGGLGPALRYSCQH